MSIYHFPEPKSWHYLNRYFRLMKACHDGLWSNIDNIHKEEHHVLPKSMGGDNSSANLVVLPSRLHYLAHWLLWKAYKSKEMTSAFFAMSNQNNDYQGRKRRITSKIYEQLKNEFSVQQSERTKELWEDPEYRQRHINSNNNPETKTLRSRKGKELWQDSEYVSKVMAAREQARLEGRVRKNHSKCGVRGELNPAKRPEVRAMHTGDNHYSRREGYVRPTCPHCGITTTKNNIQRWHGDNCKRLKS